VTFVVKPIEGPGPERFYVFDGDRRIGRISKDEDLWSWGIDWFAIGRKLLANRGTQAQRGKLPLTLARGCTPKGILAAAELCLDDRVP
jgi:hypothetical protein